MRQPLFWLAGIAGYAALVWSLPRAMELKGPRFTMNRAHAHGKAVQALRDGPAVDAGGWRWRPETEMRQYLFGWQQRSASAPSDFLATGIEATLHFFEPGTRREYLVSLCSNGRVCGIRSNRRGGPGRRPPPGKLELPAQAALAQRLFALLAGAEAGRFRPVDGGSQGEYRWTAPTSSQQVFWEIRIRIGPDGLRDAVLRGVVPEAVRSGLTPALWATGETARILSAVTFGIGAVLVAVTFLFGLLRRMIDWRIAAAAAAFVFGAGLVQTIAAAVVADNGQETLFEFQMGLLAVAVAAGCAIAVGQRMARELEWSRWRSLRLFLQGRWKARAVGQSLTHGLLAAGPLAALPCLIAASGAFPDAAWNELPFAGPMLAAIPALAVLLPPFDRVSLGLFTVALPFFGQRFGTRWVAWLVAAVLGVELAFFASPVAMGTEAILQTAVAGTVLAFVIYGGTDLLAILTAGKAAALATAAGVFLSSGNRSLDMQGFLLVAVLSGAFAGAVLLASRGIEQEPAEPAGAQYLSQREKLRAEFSLAQKAQQRLLPAEPPQRLTGFTVAADCQPARDVGGDLYDYFALPDGRTGFCVADVSGKGMQAALYMTLTKGLLAAAAPDSPGLQHLAGILNRHLQTACRRKVFVTAVMAALDPAARRVELLRAGHNPPLLFQAATATARYLKPPGIGLGLCGPGMFDRGTRPESITLAPGDALILYSDGVTEAMNADLEQYGEERFLKLVEAQRETSAASLLRSIRGDIDEFRGGEPPHDDITLLVVRAESTGLQEVSFGDLYSEQFAAG